MNLAKNLNKRIKINPNDLSILKVLSHPIRMQLVIFLIERNYSNVNTMAEHFEIPQSTVSQHLTRLRERNIVNYERKGAEVYYSIDNPKVTAIIKILAD